MDARDKMKSQSRTDDDDCRTCVSHHSATLQNDETDCHANDNATVKIKLIRYF